MAQTFNRRTADARHILRIQDRLRRSRAGQEPRRRGANRDGIHPNATTDEFGRQRPCQRVNRPLIGGIERTKRSINVLCINSWFGQIVTTF